MTTIDTPHVYHVSGWRLYTGPGIWLSLVVLLLWLAGDGATADEREAFYVTAAILTVIMLPFALITWRCRLALTDQGVTQHAFGYTIRSAWRNIESVSLSPGREGLYLTEPGTHSVLLRSLGGFGGDAVAGDAAALSEGRYIQLSPFMAHWRSGPLRRDIERWCPAAQADDANAFSAEPSPALAPVALRTRLLGVAGLVALLGWLGFLMYALAFDQEMGDRVADAVVPVGIALVGVGAVGTALVTWRSNKGRSLFSLLWALLMFLLAMAAAGRNL